MVATAQRFSELNDSVEIVWEKRSLQEFADFSIEQLAAKYDLLIIDHPWAGFASRKKVILPLDQHLSPEFMADQKENSVGASFESYSFNGHQWALATDAATPVAASRPDLLEKHGVKVPETLDDLLALAEQGLVAFPAIPIDTLMNFYMFCCSLGEDPCQREDIVVSEETGLKALRIMQQLAQKLDPACFNRNPIKTYEAMTLTDEIAYCPWAYGYSNYAREGYARKLLQFHDLISLDGSRQFISTLGGTGLAISASCRHIDIAAQYLEFANSGDCQRRLYTDNGGQPAHLSAWQDVHTNQITNNYFSATLPALQRAFLRPRYHGSMFFQDHAGDPIREYMMKGGHEGELLASLNELYRKSRTIE